jgi:YVTN family beta-propeller protein
VFVSNMQADSVAVIDTATRRVIATYPVGAGPNGISYQSVTPP